MHGYDYRPQVVAPLPKMPDVLGKLVLWGGIALGAYAYLAVHLGFMH